MLEKNATFIIAPPTTLKGPRIVKRSIDNKYSTATDSDYLEVAANVVFERLRRNTDDLLAFDHSSPLAAAKGKVNLKIKKNFNH